MTLRRYGQYKDSGVAWLGEVPAHWDIAPYKRLVDIQNGADHKHIEQDDGYPVFGSGGVFAHASEFMYDGDSVLLGRKGTIDKPLFVSGRFWTVDTMYWTRIAADANPRFAYYAALTIPFDYYSTNTALPSMTKGVLHAHLIARPPTSEQAAIATFLDHETAKIDALVDEQRLLIALLKEKRQAVISQAVTKGLDTSAPMKDSGVEWLGKVPAHWEVLRVKAASTFLTSGPRGWSDHISDDGAIFVQSGDLTEALAIDFDNAKRVAVADDAEARRTQLQVGDVLVCITGAKTGKVAVCEQMDEPAFINQHICLIRPAARLRPGYLGAYLHSESGQRYFELAQYGLKQGLSLENVKQAAVPVPPRTEQDLIVDHVSRLATELDDLTAAAEMSIALLQERRAALISAAVTGKIDVRGLAA